MPLADWYRTGLQARTGAVIEASRSLTKAAAGAVPEEAVTAADPVVDAAQDGIRWLQANPCPIQEIHEQLAEAFSKAERAVWQMQALGGQLADQEGRDAVVLLNDAQGAVVTAETTIVFRLLRYPNQ